jgi:hypothetical protein
VRPEAWLFAAVYWLWIASGSIPRALRLVPLAALGPLAWVMWDLVTAQSLLGSVGTAEGLPVANSSGGHGIGRAPSALVRFVGGFMRPPEVVAGVIGFALVCWADWRRAAVPVALIVLNVLAFAMVAERGGPIEQRYLLVASAMGIVFAAYAIAQAIEARATRGEARAQAAPDAHGAPDAHTAAHAQAAPDARRRRVARIAGIASALACIGYAVVDVGRIIDVRDQVRVSDDVYSNLRAVVQAPATRCTLAGHVHVDDVRLRPFIAYWGAVPLRRIGTEPAGSGTLVPLDPLARQLSSRSLPANPDSNPKPPPLWRLEGTCARQ